MIDRNLLAKIEREKVELAGNFALKLDMCPESEQIYYDIDYGIDYIKLTAIVSSYIQT